ncbi:hypothetical protein QJU23_03005 [Pasteurella atlantica]|uniref:Uncharacterized protein n=2 Tax=Pasteurellaceae TaxID=712 RepID=A0ACC6HKQ4_9PAST|nr:hypothetical protein [Pasteurella atlantica]MDP8051393.1 hypothetical protein [Pasteurella atlantica]MDP8104727.1 hypothetical protein [Pasteurella atlantica]MDP8148051.1 hypothetical protein [Pasteurella atlantica]
MINFFLNKKSSTHPKSIHIFQNWISKRSIIQLIILFLVSHIALATVFSLVISVKYSGQICNLSMSQDAFLYRLYFSLISQISPGFTEFIPANDVSRTLSTLNSFVGILIDAIYVTILVTKLLLPIDVFEICPYLIINEKKEELQIRLYSKYQKSVFDVEFSFFRFFIYETEEGGVLGRTEEIFIHPPKRKLLRSRYPYIIRVGLSKEETNWLDLFENEGEIRNKVPINWLNGKDEKRGHFYLLIKAQTDMGTIYQVKDYFFNKDCIKKGKAKVVFDDINVSLDDWYDHNKGNWYNWNKLD